MKSGIIQNKAITTMSVRLDSKFHLSDGIITIREINKTHYSIISLSKVTSEIYNGPRFKRIYVNDKAKGTPFMGSSNMLHFHFDSLKLISKKYSKNIDSLRIKKNWILVSCSGTIGNTVYTNENFEGKTASQHIMRIIPDKNKIKEGFLYAYLSSKYGYSLLTQGTYGAVIQHIEPEHIENIPVPLFAESKQQEIHNLIVESANLRVEANRLLEEAKSKLLSYAHLPQLTVNDYEYFGARSARTVSCFSKSIKKIDSTTINAFNHSSRIEKTKQQIRDCCKTIPLEEMLDDKKIFSTGSFPRVEVDSENGIMLINQKDIFDTIIKGKKISRRKVKTDSLVKYGEVLIAGVGTLGENETFCRAVFANQDLQDQLVSGEFIRMKTNEKYLSGYLFAWLNSNYGFRLIRSTQTGTKLCRPIPRLLLQIPIPVLEGSQMVEIDQLVKSAHTLYHSANAKETQAISLVEKEIESWQQS